MELLNTYPWRPPVTALYRPALVPDFSSARDCLERLIERSQHPDVMDLPHDAVEAILEKEGREVVRLLFQDHLDLRSLREANRKVVTGSDGVARQHRRGTSRPLRTVLGGVTIRRLSFASREVPGGLRPLDGDLNLPVEHFSLGVRRATVSFAIDASFETAMQQVNRYTGGKVSKRQLEELVGRASVDFDAFYDAQQEARLAEVSELDDLLILSTDGKGIVMLHDSLRDATKKAAEKARNKLGARLSAGEKKNRKRMAEVATVYDIRPQVRSPNDIMAAKDGKRKPASRPPRPTDKRVWASVDKSLE